MYFTNKNNTNIDKDFNNNNNIINFIKNKKIIITIIVVIILLSIIILTITSNKRNTNNNITNNTNNNNLINETIYLTLTGEENITIYEGTDYIEPGYNAYNSKNENLTNNVEIISDLDNNKIGSYEIIYKIANITKIRKINVIEKAKLQSQIYLTPIDNDINIYLKIGEKYIEPGYTVFTSNGEDLNDKVKVSGNVDTSKKGTYKLTYTLIDENNVTISKSRNIIVMDSEIALTINTYEYTNNDVSINITVNDDYFDYILLPDNNKIKNNKYSYKVSNNGEYTFITYNKKGHAKKSTIEIKNIDKVQPTGSCSGSYKNGSSTIKINASDNIGIKKYELNGTTYTNNEITIKQELKNVTIKIYDKANNTKTINCNLINQNSTNQKPTQNYEKPIAPSESNVIKKIDTDTLKVWVEKYQNYYTTHIWAQDPYKQFKSAIPENFGSSLSLSQDMLKKEISKRSLQNKAIIAINASGFSGNYGLSPITIVDGNILRNLTTGYVSSSEYRTYGLKKDGNLGHYDFKVGSNLTYNKNQAQSIINAGILYTFSFTPRLVINSKLISGLHAGNNTRQGFCQIDKNNFIFITNTTGTSNRSSGFSFESLGNYMIRLGCHTGFNLDGGGSTSLMYQDKNSTNITTLVNTTRKVADIIYFHE